MVFQKRRGCQYLTKANFYETCSCLNLPFSTHPGKFPEGPDPPLGGGDVVDHRDAQHCVKAVVLQGGGHHQTISSDGEEEIWTHFIHNFLLLLFDFVLNGTRPMC